MTDWPVIWLGVIAISVALMALIQVVVLIAIARLALQAVRGVRELRSEIRPLIEKVNQVADDARAISGMAVMQVERLEEMLGLDGRAVRRDPGGHSQRRHRPLAAGVGDHRRDQSHFLGLRAEIRRFPPPPRRRRRAVRGMNGGPPLTSHAAGW